MAVWFLMCSVALATFFLQTAKGNSVSCKNVQIDVDFGSNCSLSEVHLTCVGTNLSSLDWLWNGTSIIDFTPVSATNSDKEFNSHMNINFTATLNSMKTQNTYNSSLVIVPTNETMAIVSELGNITCGDRRFQCSIDIGEVFKTVEDGCNSLENDGGPNIVAISVPIVIILGVLVLSTVFIFVVCKWCQNKRKAQQYVPSKDQPPVSLDLPPAEFRNVYDENNQQLPTTEYPAQPPNDDIYTQEATEEQITSSIPKQPDRETQTDQLEYSIGDHKYVPPYANDKEDFRSSTVYEQPSTESYRSNTPVNS